ncbi:MAG: hypothetical protein AAGH92_08640 [Planctomycetota bacterium]
MSEQNKPPATDNDKIPTPKNPATFEVGDAVLYVLKAGQGPKAGEVRPGVVVRVDGEQIETQVSVSLTDGLSVTRCVNYVVPADYLGITAEEARVNAAASTKRQVAEAKKAEAQAEKDRKANLDKAAKLRAEADEAEAQARTIDAQRAAAQGEAEGKRAAADALVDHNK